MGLDYSIIGSRIKEARNAKKLTQEALSEQLDVSVAFLSRVERGNSKINLKRLNQICGFLDVSESYMLTGVASNESNYLDKEFAELLKQCPPEKQRMIYDIVKTIVKSK